jgi:prepilin-type N-terminal cleavage/methylation domain-containing protein
MVRKIRRNGFTIIEVIVAMTVGLIIMVAVYGYMSLVQKNSVNTDRKIVTLQDTRAVLDLMAMEIRMASYNPGGLPGTWLTIPANCTAINNIVGTWTPTVANQGIQAASASTLFIAMDLDANGTIGDQATSSPNEYIMYYYDGANTLYRNVSCGGNAAILGGSAPYSNVLNNAMGVTMFRYFDKTNTELTLPISIPDIRRILITIVADTADIDLNTKKTKQMVYSTSVMVRNHAPH